MILTKLSLQNFRSYKKHNVSFIPETTLVLGPNASGKTNLLEAVYMLSTGKSFRADSDKETLRWNEEVGRIGSRVEDDKVEMVITGGSVSGKKTAVKKFLINGVPKRRIDFIGKIKSVLFWPEDLDLVTDSPSTRRKYLDGVLIQADREYRRSLFSYERGLRQRNKLLDLINEGTASRSQLLFWNQMLIKTGGYLTEKRTEFINFINTYQLPITRYQLVYDKSVISETRLFQYKDEEIAAKYTLVGPHRDDFVFTKSQFPISNFQTNSKLENTKLKTKVHELDKFGSRGEQRLGVLWLKMAELAFINEKTSDKPVLLLDDIFSELDEEHRKLVLELASKQQTIISSAEDDTVDLLEKSGIKHQVIRLGKT
ncbi:DNA replication/repair protein RecF [Patescibacteria group bacterium]